MTAKLDNSTLRLKTELRRRALRDLAGLQVEPIVLETHGGLGKIGDLCYREVERGAVFETDRDKADLLCLKRPTWAVYEADCRKALQSGVGGHLPVSVLDVDPYGDPWPTLQAFFTSERALSPVMAVVVNDGLRQKVRLGSAWQTKTLSPVVKRLGNDLHGKYKEVCRELMQEIALQSGYGLEGWRAYYCGAGHGMTHYSALLKRR